MRRFAIGIAAVTAVYWLYALVAVPFIEPPLTIAAGNDTSGGNDRVVQTLQQHRAEMAHLFVPGAWQLENPKVLETEQGKLLFQDYEPLPNGQMRIHPCTLVLYAAALSENSAGAEKGRAIVMDAPEGAILQFDSDLDLSRAEFGKLTGGRLAGEITIASPETEPGAGDSLHIVTRNVQVDPQRVWTPHDVAFQFGPNRGSGRDLTIRLIPPENTIGQPKEMKVGGVSSLELVQVHKVHFQFGGGDRLFGKNETTPKPAEEAKPPTHVEITCRGPFLFDFTRLVASFEDQVDVFRLNENGPSDQLNCQRLSIFFARDDEEQSPSAVNTASASANPLGGSLGVEKIEALGRPVMLRSPATGAWARGERLEFNLKTKRLKLEQGQKVMLRYQSLELQAARIEYEMNPDGGLGKAWAQGPGQVRGLTPGEQQKPFDVQWGELMHLRPYEGRQVLSLTGGAGFTADQLGNMSANEMHVWLKELPAAQAEAGPAASSSAPRVQLEPDRLMALGDVRCHSPRLQGSTGRLEVWFENLPAAPPGTSPSVISGAAEDPNKPASLIVVQGDLMRLRVLRFGKESMLDDVTLEGNVRLSEMGPTEGKPPLDVSGDVLRVRQASTPAASLQVVGRPARVGARGLVLNGSNVQLLRGENKMWIEGPGSMSLPTSGELSLAGRKPAPSAAARFAAAPAPSGPREIIVNWQGGMQFDGQTVRIEQQVAARGVSHVSEQTARGQLLEVKLSRRVDFNQPNAEEVELRQLLFSGDFELENRSAELNELVSIDRLRAKNLIIDNVTGNLTADGPGWVNTIRKGNAPGNVVAGNNRSRPADESGLVYLQVDFQRGIVGNIHQREIQFLNQVKTVYGPVQRWDETLTPGDAASLDAGGVLMECDALKLVQMEGVGTQKWMELQATGNTIVEGDTFTARAHRISFTEAKYLLVLEGNGRTDAELWRQTRVGGPTSHAAAGKILYWQKENRVEVEDARFLDLSQFPSQSPPPRRR